MRHTCREFKLFGFYHIYPKEPTILGKKKEEKRRRRGGEEGKKKEERKKKKRRKGGEEEEEKEKKIVVVPRLGRWQQGSSTEPGFSEGLETAGRPSRDKELQSVTSMLLSQAAWDTEESS